MRLYELTEELYKLEDKLEQFAAENEGDITDFPFNDALEALEGDIKDKALNIGVWIKNLTSDSKAIAEEVKNLTARKKAMENKAESLKSYLQMNLTPGDKFESPNCKISWRKSESVSVTVEPENLPIEYQKIAISANKTELKTALKSGKEIPGCQIEKKENLQIK